MSCQSLKEIERYFKIKRIDKLLIPFMLTQIWKVTLNKTSKGIVYSGKYLNRFYQGSLIFLKILSHLMDYLKA